MHSVNLDKMSVDGLTYREYFNRYETLPSEAIEHLLDMYDEQYSGYCCECLEEI